MHHSQERDLLPVPQEMNFIGEIYQYFLGNFAQKEGHKGGDFFTPISRVKLIVDVIDRNYGRILDPACGGGGMLVSSGSRKISVKKKELQESNSGNLRFDLIESRSFSFT